MYIDKPSEKIKDFIDYLKQCKDVYSLNGSIMQETDKQTQDILHKLELESLNYHEHARLNKELAEVRRQRRSAKDNVIILKPIAEYTVNNKNVLNSLSQLLGAVRKEEKKLENRMYFPKSEKYKNEKIQEQEGV